MEPQQLKTGSTAKVRSVTKQAHKEVKRRRVKGAARRAEAAGVGADEVAQVVEELEAEQRAERWEQAAQARSELEERRKQWSAATTEGERVDGPRTTVSLTRRVAMTTPTTVVNQDAAAATDGLPTAHMVVNGEYREVKLDSGARYSVAGTDWMARGERLDDSKPVDQVEGIGRFLLDVLGVWVFEMRNTFGQSVQVTACLSHGAVKV
ncbi:unnamed protein product [Phytophthora lilii]|uniref:Unnamed protein product n=1 Tax=Phytophthora lilii TaxID=2077276 RepID=A0A9W6X3H1_9STRA|nr:unnamed protein product [Phytophthora lilii]